jgi:polar amino acid transport system substrate-binding protein
MEHVPSRNRTEKLNNLLTGRCDFLPTYAAYNLLSNEVLCTDVYMRFPLVVATRIDVPYINSLRDCAGRRIGLVKRIGDVERVKEKYPEIVFADCTSVPAGLRELAQGSLFGLIGPQPVVAHQIQELYLGNLKITGTLEETLRLSAVVPTEEKQLRTILQKVLLSVSPEEQERMLNRWISIRFEQGFDYRLFWKILGGTGVVLLLLLIRYRMVARYSQKLKTLNNELGQSLAERDRIMSVISHDLRQPVYGYNQMLALLQSGEINPTSGDGQRVLTQSRQRGELAIESMENLLNWLNMPRGIRHPVLLSPHRLVEDSRELLTASLEHKHLRLENRIDPGIRIRADEQRLAAVLRNLINNAIKFSPSDAVIEADAEPVNNGVMLKICDHGIGMSAETVHKILSGGPVESTRGTGGERGSGMGLGLCRQFLQVIGSDLQIESVPGQGSCISFVLRNQALRTSC